MALNKLRICPSDKVMFNTLPEDMTEPNQKYNEVMADVTRRLLSHDEIDHLIKFWDERNNELDKK